MRARIESEMNERQSQAPTLAEGPGLRPGEQMMPEAALLAMHGDLIERG